MPRKTDHERLTHMLAAAEDALRFTTGYTFEEFVDNREKIYAVIRAVEIIGEAAANISPEFRAAHHEIPWRDIVSMRNHLIHAYFDIDIPLTWTTVHNDIPPLVQILKRLLADEDHGQMRLSE